MTCALRPNEYDAQCDAIWGIFVVFCYRRTQNRVIKYTPFASFFTFHASYYMIIDFG